MPCSRRRCARLLLLFILAVPASATIFGGVRGLVHDAQHRPIAGAQVTIRAADSDWKQTAATNESGEFQFAAVPVGRYVIRVEAEGFEPQQQTVTITSGRLLNPHFPMTVAHVEQRVEVSAAPEAVDLSSPPSVSVVSREQIEETPGATATNSLAAITEYAPGAYIVHDQLHIRGGHQVEWMIDGVPVPNTSLSSNVGPQFDPKDIDSIEIQRGGFSAEYGDRAYGVFNIATRSGFERDHEGELVASFGRFLTTDDQLSFGSHTDRFAYYFSVNGNRTDFALEPPTPDNLHDQGAGLGTFGSLIFNVDPQNQLRLVTAVRGDHFQVPNTPEQQAAGTSDVEDERDAFVNFSWVHTSSKGVVVTVSPFYHFNRAHYIGGPEDQPVSPEDDRGLNYLGGVVNVAWITARSTLRAGLEGYAERDNELFAVTANDLGGSSLRQRNIVRGTTASLYLEDQVRPTSWLSLNGGLRLIHFSGPLNQDAATPRVGASVRLPRLGWVLHAFYGTYYQPPPLFTIGGPLLEFAGQQGFAFLPLPGERDQQYEFGVSIPVRKWTVEADAFRTWARDYLDHDALGNSNIFFPVALQSARIYGWEATVNSPRLLGRAQARLVYSHQFVEGKGGIVGGLTDFSPPSGGYYFLDHDQRDTLSTGLNLTLPWSLWTSAAVMYGSGFLDGDGPAHLPWHVTWDLALGRNFSEKWSAQVNVLNVMDERFLLDNSNTFGGTHFNRPREISVQLRYRFHY